MRPKDLHNEKYEGYVAADDANGSGKFKIDNIIKSFAPVFVPNSTTTVAGQAYMYKDLLYVAKVGGYQGPWDSSKFEQISIDDLFNKFRNVLSFYKQDSHVLTSSNTLSNQSYPDTWATYYKVFVPAGAVVNYKKTTASTELTSDFAYIYIVDVEGNDLYKKLGGSGTGAFDVSYTMPEDGYVSLCGTIKPGVEISIDCGLGRDFDGAVYRHLEGVIAAVDGKFAENFKKLENILSFYEQSPYVLNSDNTLSNQSYPQYWATYYKVFVPEGAVVNYKNNGQDIDSGSAYIYIIDLEGNDLYKKLGGSGTGTFDVSYTMPEDGYVSICGTPRSTIQISVNCPIGHSFEGAYTRKLEGEINSFKADTTQKFNDIGSVLQYYTQSVYALTSSNTLSNQSYPNLWKTYYKLFVPAGTVVRYKNEGSYLVSGFAYVYIIDLEGNDLYKKLGSSENTPFDIVYTMPEDGYVSLCGTPRSAIQISVNCPLSYNYYDKVVMQQVKNDVEGLKTETYIGDEFASFRKFGIVGDSLSVGYMKNPLTSEITERNIQYSWGQVLARKNNQVCLNFGKSGATTTSWWTDSLCKPKLVLPENLCQCYVVGIGTNDTITTGSMADIDWEDYDNNAESFYGHYARILQLIREVAPSAIIFTFTIPYPRESSAKNTAIREISSDAHLSSNVFLIDLSVDYNDFFKAINDKYGYASHFTAAGYAAIAKANGAIISKAIRKNYNSDVIKSIGFIPYGNNDVIE